MQLGQHAMQRPSNPTDSDAPRDRAPDVRVGDWSMPWNARDGVGRLGPGIPKSDFWASAKEGIDQVGCVYRPMDGGWVGQRDQSHDRVVRRGVTEAEFTRNERQHLRELPPRLGAAQTCCDYLRTYVRFANRLSGDYRGRTMVRRVNPAQHQAMLRQAAQKQKSAIDAYNRTARKHNAEVRRQHDRFRRAVGGYNRGVRVHNARVEERRRVLRAALQRLSAGRVAVRSTTYFRSVATLHEAYEAVERAAPGSWMESREDILDLAQQEAANSLALADAVEGAPSDALYEQGDPDVERRLSEFSQDLASRWRGALYSLHPLNPDAARHFSASSREILVRIIEGEAPDEEVLASNPAAPLVDGKPTRRARLAHCLVRAGRSSDPLVAFADSDVDEVVELFKVFNDGTHGVAGVFDMNHLSLIRRRVEGAVTFLHSILRG